MRDSIELHRLGIGRIGGIEPVTIGAAGQPLIEPGELAVQIVDYFFRDRVGPAREVKGPARQASGGALSRRSVCEGE